MEHGEQLGAVLQRGAGRHTTQKVLNAPIMDDTRICPLKNGGAVFAVESARLRTDYLHAVLRQTEGFLHKRISNIGVGGAHEYGNALMLQIFQMLRNIRVCLIANNEKR